MPDEKKEQSIGALWLNKEKGFMTGNVEIDGKKVDIIVFKNDRKTEDRFPDWRIFKKKPKEAAADKMGLPPEESGELEAF